MDVKEMARMGGRARAESMSDEERRASAKKAVEARWAKVKKAGKKPAAKGAGKKAGK